MRAAFTIGILALTLTGCVEVGGSQTAVNQAALQFFRLRPDEAFQKVNRIIVANGFGRQGKKTSLTEPSTVGYSFEDAHGTQATVDMRGPGCISLVIYVNEGSEPPPAAAALFKAVTDELSRKQDWWVESGHICPDAPSTIPTT